MFAKKVFIGPFEVRDSNKANEDLNMKKPQVQNY